MSKWGLIDRSLEGRQRLFFPHFVDNCVPLDSALNARWRSRVFFTRSKDDRRVLRRMCREDFLFYLVGFVSLFDAGDESGKPGPVSFLPYEFQIECFTAMWDAMHGDHRHQVRMKKPRRLGFTWMVMALFEHCWHFMSNRHLLVGSQREEDVDGPAAIGRGDAYAGEWSKLMPKVDFIHLYQPPWLRPMGYRPRVEPYRTRLKVINPETGSIIWGTSASGKSGRSGRGWGVFWDEAAHTDGLYEIIGALSAFSACKFWVSSIDDLSHAFSTTLRDAPNVFQLAPQWWMNPEYSRGLTVDPETGERSSPWLERKLDEINHDAAIANREYFADETKQIGGFYHPDTFRKMLGTSDRPGTVMEPLQVGMLDVIDGPAGGSVSRFVSQSGGRWKFWMEFGSDGRPSRNTKYAMGCDIAAGTTDSDGRGASNSVLVIVDWMTGAVVAQFVNHGMRPDQLAHLAAAAGRWFEGEDFAPARISFERNGPGAIFGESLVGDLQYPNVWRDADEKFGWWKGGANEKARLAFGLHQQMLCEGRLIERCEDCVAEMRHYRNPSHSKGAPIHSAALHSQDPSGARDNHGDRTIARVVVCQIIRRGYEPVIESATAAWGSARFLRDRRAKEAFEDQLV